MPGPAAQAKLAPVSQVEARFKLKPQPNARRGAVLILFYKKANDWYFPLIQRPEYDGHHGGQVGLPGGKVEPNDKDIIHTALRETEEEIGVSQASIKVLGSLTDLYIPPSKFLVSPVVGWVEGVPSFVPDPVEVDEILETSLQELLHPEAIQHTAEPPGISSPLETPYFALQERVVWGATGMMLSELSHILQEAGN